MNIESTLTRAEREAPFQLGGDDPEPLQGPTRVALEIVETGGICWFSERDPGRGFALVCVHGIANRKHATARDC